MKHFRHILTLLLLVWVTTLAAQTVNIRTKHKVEKSETIFGIAKKYGLTIEEVIEANPEMKQQGYELKRDDVIFIPYGKNQASTAASTQKTTATTATTPKPTTTAVAGKKEVKVGVMLPLHDNDGDGRRMVEYYRGLLLGIDRVKKDGITVDLQAWNVPIDADINNTLKEKEAAECDIIIGPL